MPKKLEAILKKEAEKKDVRDPDAYVYDTLHKIEEKQKRLKMKRGR